MPVRNVTASVSCRIIGSSSLLVRSTASPCFSAPELGVGLAGVAGDAGALEGRHLAEDASGGLDDAHRKGRPSALAEPHLPVSYTHLRAHETDSYLVCRLLLEKKKQERHPTK